MTNRLILLSLILHVSFAFAQVDLKMGPCEPSFDYLDLKVLKEMNGKVYSVGRKSSTYFLVSHSGNDMEPEYLFDLRYRSDLSVGSSVEKISPNKFAKLNIEKNEDNIRIDNYFLIQDKVYIIYSKLKAQSISYYSQIFDLNGKLVSSPTLLKTIDGYQAKNVIHLLSFSRVKFSIASDSNSFFLLYIPFSGKDENTKYTFSQWDLNFNLITETEVLAPNVDKETYLNDYFYTTDGHYVVLYSSSIPRRKRSAPGIDREFKLLSFDLNQKTVRTLPGEFPDKAIASLNIRKEEGNIVLGVGNYSDVSGEEDYSGSFVFKTDFTNADFSQTKFLDFDAEQKKVLNRFLADRKKNATERYSFILKQIIQGEKNSFYYILEVDEDLWHSNTAANGQTTSGTNSITVDVIVIKMDGDGNFLWHSVIPKLQRTQYSGNYNSIAAGLWNNALHIFYNEEPRNLEQNIFKYGSNTNSAAYSVPVTCVMNIETGSFEKNALVEPSKDRDNLFKFRDFYIFSDNSLLIQIYDKNETSCYGGDKQVNAHWAIISAK